MTHAEIRWNPELREWFCLRCGTTSDRTTKGDAQAELQGSYCFFRNGYQAAGGRSNQKPYKANELTSWLLISFRETFGM